MLRGYPSWSLEIEKYEVARDAMRVVDCIIQELGIFNELDPGFVAEVRNTLRKRSEGTFLWAGFAITELLPAQTKAEMREVLHSIPPALRSLYSHIPSRIKRLWDKSLSRLLHWVSQIPHPLLAAQLVDALDLPADTVVDLVKMSGSLLACGKAEQLVPKLQHGADANVLDPSGVPVLHSAIRIEDNAAKPWRGGFVELLLEIGADPNTRDKTGLSALHVSATRGFPSAVMAMLLRHGADAYTKDPIGRSVLHYLAHDKESVATAQHLLDLGLDPEDCNNKALHP
jgi:hypothetical protein